MLTSRPATVNVSCWVLLGIAGQDIASRSAKTFALHRSRADAHQKAFARLARALRRRGRPEYPRGAKLQPSVGVTLRRRRDAGASSGAVDACVLLSPQPDAVHASLSSVRRAGPPHVVPSAIAGARRFGPDAQALDATPPDAARVSALGESRASGAPTAVGHDLPARIARSDGFAPTNLAAAEAG